eukprot:6803691-Pyramimonas_sp.AAC.1
MNVAILEEHTPEKIFKELLKLHRQAASARDQRAENAGQKRKFDTIPPWRVLDAELASIVKAKCNGGAEMDLRCWSGR